MMFTKEEFFKKLLEVDILLKKKKKGPAPESVLVLNEQQYKDFQEKGWIDKNGNINLKIKLC